MKEKIWKRLILNKVINEKCFFALMTSNWQLSISCCKKYIKTSCDILPSSKIVKHLCLIVDELLQVFFACRLPIWAYMSLKRHKSSCPFAIAKKVPQQLKLGQKGFKDLNSIGILWVSFTFFTCALFCCLLHL